MLAKGNSLPPCGRGLGWGASSCKGLTPHPNPPRKGGGKRTQSRRWAKSQGQAMTDSFGRSTRSPLDARGWGLTRRAWFKASGYDDVDLTKPVIGIAQTWSELNHCHSHFRTLAESVKRGVWQAGGWPLEFPTISLGEFHIAPTTMLYRNLLAMNTEEMIRAQPLDGVVLLASCDKNVPAQLMAAASADRPALLLTGGPMLAARRN